ncbi:MAG: metallophosphoesterase [Pseudomonadota bacterium]
MLRLAHLSDLHLPLGLPRGAEWAGKRALSGLSWLRKRRRRHRMDVAQALRADLLAHAPDMIAVTGDVVNFSCPHEFTAAAEFLAGLGPPQRVIVLDGNHEALVAGWRARMRVWGAYAPAQTPVTRRVGDVALIAVSTAIATPPLLATGRVGPAAVVALAGRVAEARAAGLCPIVLMHHPPVRLTRARKALRDEGPVAAALAKAGAALVLHGHTHRAEMSQIPSERGPIPVLGVPAFSLPAAHGPGLWREITLATEKGWVEIRDHAITPDLTVVARTPLRLHLPQGSLAGGAEMANLA